jgi:large subunit ribosomal protein L22
MTGTKTNERPGTRAVLRYSHMSASKVRVVLDLIRGADVTTAREILNGTTREAASVIGKVLASAVANAVNNEGLVAEELYVASAYADEGPTAKRFTPRARGRAGRIRKRTAHITVVVARMEDVRIARVRASRADHQPSRSRRVASSRRRADQQASFSRREDAREAAAAELEAEATEMDATETTTEVESTESDVTEVETTDVETTEVATNENETTAPEGTDAPAETSGDSAEATPEEGE